MPFDITFGGFINFFLGMVTGVIVFLAMLTFFTFRGKRVNLEKIKRPEGEFDENELVRLVESRQQLLKRNMRHSSEGAASLTVQASYELIEEISRYFFRDSKYPMLELSVHELIDLNRYISDRIDALLNVPVLKNAKNIRIIQIVKMYERKKYLEESRVAKAAKKYKFGKVLKYGGMALNAVNPVYWFRKLVINTSIEAMTRKVCVVVLGVVGEETTKVYSKKLFDKEIDLGLVDGNMDDLLLEAEEDNEVTNGPN